MTPGLFITGTGTEVGKTYVAALIAKSLRAAGRRVGVYKPVASGCVRDGDEVVSEDGVRLWEACGRTGALEQVCPQRFVAPLAPHLAAREEGRTVDFEQAVRGLEFWRERSDVVLVEGAGGLMSPVSDEQYNADLAQRLGYPLVIVAPNRLGVINATMLTLLAAERFGLPVAGIVLNDVDGPRGDRSTQSNFRELQGRCKIDIVTQVAWNDEAFREPVDRLCRPKATGP